jgi:putative Holliday junction resolvase
MARILAIDYGSRRIGIALSDALGITAQPLEIIHHTNKQADLGRIGSIIAEKKVERIVIGLPINMDGNEGPNVDVIRRFAAEIETRFKLPVELYDERLTTMQAERMLVEEADMSRAKRKTVKDKIAASILLQSYLEHIGGPHNR